MNSNPCSNPSKGNSSSKVKHTQHSQFLINPKTKASGNMKFSALVVALATLAQAKKPISISKDAIQGKLNGANPSTFLKRARKLEDVAEEAEADQYYYQNNFALDSSYSMKFDQCVSYQVGQGKDGEYVGINDYVLVKMVNSYGKVDAVYAVPVGEFIKDMGSMVYNQHESYCSACEDAKCNYGYDENAEDENAEDENADNYYNIVTSGNGVEVVDCDVCAAHCGGNDDTVYYDQEEVEDMCGRRTEENADVDDQSAWEFVSQIAECQQIYDGGDQQNQYSYQKSYSQMQEDEEEKNEQGDYYDDGSIYMGVKCNTAGDGFDLAYFINDECTVMDVSGHRTVTDSIGENSVAFASFMHMRTLAKGIFSGTKMSCEDVEYSSGFYNGNNNENKDNEDNENNENDYNNNSANEYCNAAVYGENSLNLNSCNGDNYELCTTLTSLKGSSNPNYFNMDEYDAEEREEGDDDAEVDADELDEDGDVFGFTDDCWGQYCFDQEEYANYEGCDYSNNYSDETDFGAWVNRNESNGVFSGVVGGKNSPWAVAGVIASLAAIGAIAFVVLKKRSVENESLGEYMLEDPKPVDEKIV